MITLAALVFLPPCILLLMAALPNRWVNSAAEPFRLWITGLAGLQFILAASLALAHAAGLVPTVHRTLAGLSGSSPLALVIYYDGVASLMLALVSFVGWVICRYSIRHLDGEATQGRYFRWAGFTVGAVSLMVISGNLLMFILAWVMTSLGLHQLLLHYGHRPAARRAAGAKFTISRIGDAALIAAAVLIYSEFQTLDFAALFAAVGSQVGGPAPTIQVATFLLVAAALTKSAQVPFHTWLPQTMETPTPVSALMHAGIVNAGGYLIIRASPLLSLTPGALTLLAISGALTACFAAVVMLTQTNVKQSLAYSTIAQMGFMMLQCGLGAYSAAMLHILAHSLYKSYAFLSSGSVISERAAVVGASTAMQHVPWPKHLLAGAGVIGLLGIAFAAFGVNPITKPGGILLSTILWLALSHWIGRAMQTGHQRLIIRAISVAGGLCFLYVASFVAIDVIVASSVPSVPVPAPHWSIAAIASVICVGTVLVGAHLSAAARQNWSNALYVHASNGFYIENCLRRVFGPLVSS